MTYIPPVPCLPPYGAAAARAAALRVALAAWAVGAVRAGDDADAATIRVDADDATTIRRAVAAARHGAVAMVRVAGACADVGRVAYAAEHLASGADHADRAVATLPAGDVARGAAADIRACAATLATVAARIGGAP